MSNIRPLAVSPPVKTSELARGLMAGADFKSLYRAVMTIVDDTASYLDGEGRAAARSLYGIHAAGYSRHSLDLTTAIMNLASIALALKEASQGHRVVEAAVADVMKLGRIAREPQRPTAELHVPDGLELLIDRTRAVHAQLTAFVSKLVAGDEPVDNPVHKSLHALQAALGSGAA